jgi:hypothetical protein
MANLIEELSLQARKLPAAERFDWPRNFDFESPISTLVRPSSFPLKKYLHKFDVC